MPGPVDYLSAVTGCIARGGILVSIQSLQEQKGIEALLGNSDAWIGLTDFREEGNFTWVDDEAAFGFSYWNHGAVKNGDGGQHCVIITGQEGKWENVICGRKEKFVCQELDGSKGPRDKMNNKLRISM